MTIIKDAMVATTTTALAVMGTFAINSFVVHWLEGKTIENAYLPTFIDTVAYSLWFMLLATCAVKFLKARQFLLLLASSILAFGFFCFFTEIWVNPELSLFHKVLVYFQAHIASFMVIPAFSLIGFLAQQAAPK